MNPNAVQMRAVTKHYRGFTLGPVDMQVARSKVVAIVGPNGAGKTTTLNLIAGAASPLSGEVEVLGMRQGVSRERLNQMIGYASDAQPLYEDWTVRQNLTFSAAFHPNWSKEYEMQLIDRLGVQADKKVKTLSRGNRLKVALVIALAIRPSLLLLDEPTAGLDPLVRTELLDVLFDLIQQDEVTILYSTHVLSDINKIADELIFMRNGVLLQHSDCADLQQRWGRLAFRLEAASTSRLESIGLLGIRSEGSMHLAATADVEQTVDKLQALGATRLEVQRLSLDEIAVQVLRQGAQSVQDAMDGTVEGGDHAAIGLR